MTSRARPGRTSSMWTSADEAQREALGEVFTGQRGGTPHEQFPWAFKPANLLAVRPAAIEIDHTPGRGRFRAGGEVSVRVEEPGPDQEPVPCPIPGPPRNA